MCIQNMRCTNSTSTSFKTFEFILKKKPRTHIRLVDCVRTPHSGNIIEFTQSLFRTATATIFQKLTTYWLFALGKFARNMRAPGIFSVCSRRALSTQNVTTYSKQWRTYQAPKIGSLFSSGIEIVRWQHIPQMGSCLLVLFLHLVSESRMYGYVYVIIRFVNHYTLHILIE